MLKRTLPLAALILAGCASAAPAPISFGQANAQAASNDQEQSVPPSAEVQSEETSGLSTYALRPQDVAPFDPTRLPNSHRVGANESLYDIATRYQIPTLALNDQNGLEPPYALTPGRVLALPPPRVHVVARGESFRDIAERYSMDPRSLALLNRLQAPYEVRTGDRIVLPAVATAPSAPERPRSETPLPAEGARARFAWPVRGEVVTRFGAQSNGVRVDGIEIRARADAPILAAADGDVVYAGADLAAYGALVLVRHADNFVTAYAYGARALVREGQSVRQGEPLAQAGERGRILFQVRRGRNVLDPAPLLTGGAR